MATPFETDERLAARLRRVAGAVASLGEDELAAEIGDVAHVLDPTTAEPAIGENGRRLFA